MASRVARPPRHEEPVKPKHALRRANPPIHRALRQRYVVLEKLGSGCAGTVVRAVDRMSRKEVAVKIVPKRLLIDREWKTALAREVFVLAKLEHPHVVKFHNAFEDSEYVYIATEFCPNGDMLDYVRSRPQGLQEREALKYLRQVLQALEYLHAQRIAHRDVKLENVVFVGGKVKLIDFGLCYWRRPGGDKYTKQRCGTPQYAAPEIMLNTPYMPEQGDMWACGVMLYTMLTRTLPFTGRTWSDLERSITSVDTEAMLSSQRLSHISPGTRQLLRKLLHVSPVERPTPRDALQILDTAILNCIIPKDWKCSGKQSGR